MEKRDIFYVYVTQACTRSHARITYAHIYITYIHFVFACITIIILGLIPLSFSENRICKFINSRQGWIQKVCTGGRSIFFRDKHNRLEGLRVKITSKTPDISLFNLGVLHIPSSKPLPSHNKTGSGGPPPESFGNKDFERHVLPLL